MDSKWLCLLIIFGACLGAQQAMSRTMLHETYMTSRHEQWMTQYGRVYKDDAEKELRFNIFKENVELIESFNANNNHPSYKLGINEFTDLTKEEFKATRFGFNPDMGALLAPSPSSSSSSSFMYENLTEVPSSMDWREKGVVTPIKDQGQCGCCWAFSAVAAVEGITKLKTDELVSLSEQQLLNCVTENQGCNGGFMDYAFQYIEQNGGLITEANYPYQEMDGTCDDAQMSAYPAAAQIKGYEDVPANSEDALLKAVSNQPVSVAVNADGFHHYSSGVFTGDCGTDLNHAVTAIGYGTTDDGTQYWLLKNSWGTSWGEDGYMRLLRGVSDEGGLCGIARMASYPIA